MTSEGTMLTCANFPAPLLFFFFNDTATTEIYTLSLHDALPILSDIADTELSEIVRAPAKTLPMTTEGTMLTCANFPAPFLTESAITQTTLSGLILTPC